MRGGQDTFRSKEASNSFFIVGCVEKERGKEGRVNKNVQEK
jgi:hypothetical protein